MITGGTPGSLPEAAAIRATFRRLSPERHPILDQTYHSPRWWQSHVASSGRFDIQACDELHDDSVFWEDDVLYRGDRAGWSRDFLSQSAWLIRHFQYGRTHAPRLTHLLLAASRRPSPSPAITRATA